MTEIVTWCGKPAVKYVCHRCLRAVTITCADPKAEQTRVEFGGTLCSSCEIPILDTDPGITLGRLSPSSAVGITMDALPDCRPS